SGSVDFAYSLLTLQHVEREHAFKLLREVRRVVRDGGRAFLTFPNLLSDEYLQAFLHYVDVDEVSNPARARFYTPQEVERLLPAAGFEIESLEPETEIVVTCKTA
ncbi:MAG TPA: methyltransferase domain-containing protein, partial [Gaiellaceae bacterium]